MLEYHADILARLAQLLFAQGQHILPVDEHLPRRGALQQIDATDERRLARTGQADNAIDFAGINGQIDALQRMHRPRRAGISFLDMRKLDHEPFTSLSS